MSQKTAIIVSLFPSFSISLSSKPMLMDFSVVKSSCHSRLASKLSVLESFLPYAGHVLYQYMEGAMSSVENNLVTMITLWSNEQVRPYTFKND